MCSPDQLWFWLLKVQFPPLLFHLPQDDAYIHQDTDDPPAHRITPSLPEGSDHGFWNKWIWQTNIWQLLVGNRDQQFLDKPLPSPMLLGARDAAGLNVELKIWQATATQIASDH